MVIKCRQCLKEKPESEFGFYGTKRRKNCNSCRDYLLDYNKQNREHLLEMRRLKYHLSPERKQKNAEYMRNKRSNPDRRRQLMGAHIKRKYGVSLEWYDETLKKQDGKCAICRERFPESFQMWNRPCVDHCHKTKKVRGILCRKCNISLHYIESFNFLTAAQRYLQVNEVEDKEPLA